MTTIIIDGKTKSIYCDSRGTETTVRGSSSIFGIELPNTKSATVNFNDNIQKVFFISPEVGYILATGKLDILHKCVELSRKSNAFVLPKAYNKCNTTIINVRQKGENMDVIKYCSKTNKRWFGLLEHYWDNWWEIFLEDKISFYGSGSELAKEAYENGADPEKAIMIASKKDYYSNNNVKTYHVVK